MKPNFSVFSSEATAVAVVLINREMQFCFDVGPAGLIVFSFEDQDSVNAAVDAIAHLDASPIMSDV